MSRLKEKRQARRERKANRVDMKEQRREQRNIAKIERAKRRAKGEGFFGPKGALKNIVDSVSGVADTVGSALEFGNNAGGYIEDASNVIDAGQNVRNFVTGEGGQKAGMSGITKILMVGVLGYAVIKMFTGKKRGIRR